MYDGEYCIMREETVRERRGSYNEFCCRLYPFICWIIIKEGPGNFSGGRSPHWVNQINLHVSLVLCIFCVFFPHLFYFIAPWSYFSNGALLHAQQTQTLC
jgi:hypothetical protein